MIVRAEKLRAFHADGPITKRCAFGGAGDNSDMVGHDLILQKCREPQEQPMVDHWNSCLARCWFRDVALPRVERVR